MGGMPAHPCSRCGSPATLFLGSVAGQESLTLAFCDSCAPKGVAEAALPATAAGLSPIVPMPASRARCPQCGFRWSDFERHQRLGCPACYASHSAQALALVGRSQPGLTHQGRRPGAPVAPLQREMEELRPAPTRSHPSAKELETALEAAVRAENYEEAARLRDLLSRRRAAR